jgi:hypothetical protein
MIKKVNRKKGILKRELLWQITFKGVKMLIKENRIGKINLEKDDKSGVNAFTRDWLSTFQTMSLIIESTPWIPGYTIWAGHLYHHDLKKGWQKVLKLNDPNLEDVLDVRPSFRISARHEGRSIPCPLLSTWNSGSDKEDPFLGKITASTCRILKDQWFRTCCRFQNRQRCQVSMCHKFSHRFL